VLKKSSSGVFSELPPFAEGRTNGCWDGLAYCAALEQPSEFEPNLDYLGFSLVPNLRFSKESNIAIILKNDLTKFKESKTRDLGMEEVRERNLL